MHRSDERANGPVRMSRSVHRTVAAGVLLGLLVQTALVTAQPDRIEVAVRPLSAAPIALQPGRGSARRDMDDLWERVRETEAFVVEVTITNSTPRAYRLKVAAINLRTGAGERVRPIDSAEHVPQPVLTDQTVKAGSTARGYVSYPPGTYAGAAGYLIEEATQANEGFSVKF